MWYVWVDGLMPVNCLPTKMSEIHLGFKNKGLIRHFRWIEKNAMGDLTGDVTDTKYYRPTRWMSMAATLPGAMKSQLDGTASYRMDSFDHKNTKAWNPIMKSITRGSPKLDYIKNELMHRILKDPGWRKSHAAPGKILSFAQHPFVAGVTAL